MRVRFFVSQPRALTATMADVVLRIGNSEPLTLRVFSPYSIRNQFYPTHYTSYNQKPFVKRARLEDADGTTLNVIVKKVSHAEAATLAQLASDLPQYVPVIYAHGKVSKHDFRALFRLDTTTAVPARPSVIVTKDTHLSLLSDIELVTLDDVPALVRMATAVTTRMWETGNFVPDGIALDSIGIHTFDHFNNAFEMTSLSRMREKSPTLDEDIASNVDDLLLSLSAFIARCNMNITTSFTNGIVGSAGKRDLSDAQIFEHIAPQQYTEFIERNVFIKPTGAPVEESESDSDNDENDSKLYNL